MITNLQDLDDTWKEESKKINDRIKEAAIKNGITNDKYANYKFQAFNIQDMYRNKDGKICYNCMRSKKCEIHKYERQGKDQLLKNDSQFK